MSNRPGGREFFLGATTGSPPFFILQRGGDFFLAIFS
jgi:hypothetical protein